ncbi:MAG TPA: ABC-type transport auxiliary lipoprotein family protein [Kofleriaceae bacterium]|jgi:ABC-type uncharacterized transport system auxiliary subunit|nr:ABC-type transport auxiliary lipoprotein family protein [Kofleriaceae bacterium]
MRYALIILAACGGKLPETRYYALSAPPTSADHGTLDLAVEPLSTEPGYDDERIVYRQSPYRLDYYQYHRWSAAPGVVVGGYLAQGLEATGKFHSVAREPTDKTPLVIGGRVLALEEVDQSATRWLGHIVVELTATDRASGAVVWTQRYDDTEPLATQSPEGLARAISTAMGRIVDKAASAIGGIDAPKAATR